MKRQNNKKHGKKTLIVLSLLGLAFVAALFLGAVKIYAIFQEKLFLGAFRPVEQILFQKFVGNILKEATDFKILCLSVHHSIFRGA